MTKQELEIKIKYIICVLEDRDIPPSPDTLQLYRETFQIAFDDMVNKGELYVHHFPFEVETKMGFFHFKENGDVFFIPKRQITEVELEFTVLPSSVQFD